MITAHDIGYRIGYVAGQLASLQVIVGLFLGIPVTALVLAVMWMIRREERARARRR